MSVFVSQPSFTPPPSYSRPKIQPPPYKAPMPSPNPSTFSFFKRVFTNTNTSASTSTSTSTSSILLSTAKTNTSSTTSPTSQDSSPTDREQSLPNIPPPTYSPIKSGPKPSSPPAYSANSPPRPGTGINLRSDTFIPRGEVVPGQSHGLAFGYEAEEWEVVREREERRIFDEREQSHGGEQGCCAWWFSEGADPMPWATYYIF